MDGGDQREEKVEEETTDRCQRGFGEKERKGGLLLLGSEKRRGLVREEKTKEDRSTRRECARSSHLGMLIVLRAVYMKSGYMKESAR